MSRQGGKGRNVTFLPGLVMGMKSEKGIDRIGVEKTTFDLSREINGAPAKLCSGTENRDASISLCKDTVNACKISMVWAALDGKVPTRLPNGAGLAGLAGW